ncbi:fumarylacetoacetate hydrolase family protein [Bordetella sp. LUAb4]|uniref:fumarylacetoacetate hydrolase family protein n=1 Tax=Bordetella sp. LUAb4 TaxID=2843195 RepID=UPI001E49C8F6|nr:fumarylacetoacetate hydrolase family protein [Bordetella sp. LUAb4]
MKFLSFTDTRQQGQGPQLGIALDNGKIFNVTAAVHAHPSSPAASLPLTLEALIDADETPLQALAELARDPANAAHVVEQEQIRYLPPVQPRRNVFCVGRNYREHIIEGNIAKGIAPNTFPEAIEFFTKPSTAVVGHGWDVNRHAALTNSLDYEVELAIVIGKRGVNISEADALDHVFGYTVVNDVTARDLQRRHGQWFKGKGLDTTCPMGPVIVHKSVFGDPNAKRLELEVNGELRQSANTDEMIFNVQAVIAQLSAGLTLLPGDIISTGTPKGVGYAAIPPRCLNVGDVVTARVDGIGELTNRIVE